MTGDKERDRERESKEKEPKEKKRHRRLSIKRRVRKSTEMKQPLTPIEIDWTKCMLYSYSAENLKFDKINESDLKIENIIGRHRCGMVGQHI